MDNQRRRRTRRGSSPAVIERLERSRNRIRERRAAAVKREHVVTAAVEEYIHAWHAITTVEQTRNDEIAALEQQIKTVRAQAASDIAAQRRQQAAAAAAIRDQGHSDDDVADLLEITPKQARQLIASANAVTGGATATPVGKTNATPISPTAVQPGDHSSVVAASAGNQQSELDLAGKGRARSRSGSSGGLDSSRSGSERDRPT